MSAAVKLRDEVSADGLTTVIRFDRWYEIHRDRRFI